MSYRSYGNTSDCTTYIIEAHRFESKGNDVCRDYHVRLGERFDQKNIICDIIAEFLAVIWGETCHITRPFVSYLWTYGKHLKRLHFQSDELKHIVDQVLIPT